MSSTVDWADEESTDVQTEAYSSEAITSTERNPADAKIYVLLSYKIALIVVGVLGTLSNGLVLGGFWHSRRSAMTPSSVHIANHTTLELLPFCPNLPFS